MGQLPKQVWRCRWQAWARLGWGSYHTSAHQAQQNRSGPGRALNSSTHPCAASPCCHCLFPRCVVCPCCSFTLLMSKGYLQAVETLRNRLMASEWELGLRPIALQV